MPLLLLLALLAGGAAYYEYSWEQQSTSGFQDQIQQWESQLAQLKSENKKLNEQKKSLNPASAPSLLPTNNGGLTSLPGQPPALPPPTGSAPIEDLATFTTITGKTYQDPKLLKIEASDIVISSADGITQVSYAIMPPEMQRRFGWDPKTSTSMNAAEIRYQEQMEAARAAAASDGANAAPATAPTNPNLVPGMAPAPGTTPP